MMKPRIGITMDRPQDKSYSNYPWYALRENYAQALVQCGALPFALSYAPECIDDYLTTLDGLLITGGNFDIPPSLYGNDITHQEVRLNQARTTFEMALIKRALEKDIPFLGVCGGQQLLNVALGGTLIQYIPDYISSDINHKQEQCRHEPVHDIHIVQGTLLASFLESVQTIAVNSSHQQAVDKVGQGVIVNARAPDGIIEGIEVPDRKFCLGVQWHPEFQVNSLDSIIFERFVSACKH